MPIIDGRILGLARGEWEDFGNGLLGASRHGARLRYLDHETGQMVTKFFRSRAMVHHQNNIITYILQDAFDVLEDVV